MKVVLIGGGGARTPAALYAFARCGSQVPLEQIVLHDIDLPRMRAMQAVCESLLEGLDMPFRVTFAEEPERAIAGADVVIVSVRVGGQAARAADERIALQHGCIGQETTGPGGFSYALRSIPVVSYYAGLVGRLAPKAWLINFTNPAGLVTQALSQTSPVPIVGVCDSPQDIARRVCDAAGIPEDQLDWRYSGLNHLGWLTSARYQGRELLPALLADDAALGRLAQDDLIPAALIRHLGAVPNEYCYYYYLRDQALERQRAAPETRGQLLARLDGQLERDLAQAGPDDAAQLVVCYGRYCKAREESYLAAERQSLRRLPEKPLRELILSGGQGYMGVAFKIIAGLAGAGVQRAVLNVPNSGGIIPGMDEDDIVETMCEIRPEGILPLPGPLLLPESLALLQMVKAYERLAAAAARTGSRWLAIRALTHHPLVASYPLAEKLVDAYLREHRAFLPRFWRQEP
jgi:alpha-galactosidase/6-phospho-beta-glucosidase family protein